MSWPTLTQLRDEARADYGLGPDLAPNPANNGWWDDHTWDDEADEA